MTISEGQLRTILFAIEFGYKACEKGKSLNQAFIEAKELYKVEKK